MASIFDVLRGRSPEREEEIKRRAEESIRKYETATGQPVEQEQGLEEGNLADYVPGGMIGRIGMLKKLKMVGGKRPPGGPKKPGTEVVTGEKGQKVEVYKEQPSLDYGKMRQADQAKKAAGASVTKYKKEAGDANTQVTNRKMTPEELRKHRESLGIDEE